MCFRLSLVLVIPHWTAKLLMLFCFVFLLACASLAPLALSRPSADQTPRPSSADPCSAATPTRDYWKPDGRAGDLEFDIPNGWKKVEDQSFVMLTPAKAQPRQTVRIGLLNPQTLTGDVRQYFATVWNQWRQQINMIDNGKPELTRSPRGFELLSAYTRIYSQSLGNGTFKLAVAHMGNRAQPYFYLNNTGSVDDDLAFDTFQHSVRFANAKKSSLPEPGVPCGLQGIYTGFRVGESVTSSGFLRSATLKTGILVFLPDGNVLRELPEHGLDNFDFGVEIKKSRDYCGRYRMIGDSFKITWSDDATSTGSRQGKKLMVDGFDFNPALNSDGLQLNGTYRGDRAPTDARIRFTPDGNFVENGILEAIDFSGQNKSPGNGTYSIQQNTLHLHYASGHNVRLSFYIMSGDDPGAHPKLIHINSHAFLPAK